MSHMKVVATFVYPHEANLADSLLQSEGIESILEDEFTVGIYNGISNALGGVKLLVKEKDFERAIEILTESGTLSPEEE